MEVSPDTLSFLEKSALPWVQYKLTKMREPESPQLAAYKQAILEDGRVQGLIDTCLAWPEPSLTRHNDAKHPLHQMNLLLDLGLHNTDAPIRQIAEKILDTQDESGAFPSLVMIPTHFGGSGNPEMQWMLCDFPLLLNFLIRAGYAEDPRLRRGIGLLAELAQENGWRCRGSVAKFRGPGKKEDHCPFATLTALEVFSLLPEFHGEPFVRAGVDAICGHWTHRQERKIYLFGMGTDFAKLKYPCVWYDTIHVCRVLSRFSYARDTAAFSDMMGGILSKQVPGGGFIPESVYMAYKSWDFGRKKEPSPTLTLAVYEMTQAV